MTIFLICMIPVSAFFGFMLCALLTVASAADRREEEYFVQLKEEKEKEKEANT